jgi:hypothetical protein
MAIIAQMKLFSWKEVEVLGDLERLELVLRYMPDEKLMGYLEGIRYRGRDEYPVRAVWNSLLAGIVYQHESIEGLRRELARNGQLRQLCGFDPSRGLGAVPPSWVYSRFLKGLLGCVALIEEIFDRLVEELRGCLPDFGQRLAVDGKALPSHARRKGGCGDGRREGDADLGTKTYRGERAEGKLWEKVKRWFGFKLHLLVDADYELPVAYEVSRASVADITGGKELVAKTARRHPEVLWTARELSGDKGYDDGKLIRDLWDTHRIKPVIDIRNLWQDGEQTRLIEGQGNVVYDYRGTVYCHCPATDQRRQMAFGGFEKGRETLKYRCPARHYGMHCAGVKDCAVAAAVRIPLSEDRRVFTPLARSSYAWAKAYKKRTAVERVNSRMDGSFGFERHFIRGLAKMRCRVGLALCVMLAMALGRSKEDEAKHRRSLVWSKAA